MKSIKKTARIAGLLYLILAITGAFSMMYVPSKLIVWGDAATTANNIMASEWLFRISIVSALICQIIFIFLVLMLYRLFKEVNPNYALLMLTLVVVAVPIAFLNMLNQIAVLLFLSGDSFLKIIEPSQRHTWAMICLHLHNYGIMIVQIFWGLWLFPFGLLVLKSGFIPRILGILLLLAGVGYLVDSFTHLLLPHLSEFVSSFATIPSAIGELLIVLWLLIVGVKVSKINSPQQFSIIQSIQITDYQSIM